MRTITICRKGNVKLGTSPFETCGMGRDQGLGPPIEDSALRFVNHLSSDTLSSERPDCIAEQRSPKKPQTGVSGG